MADKENNLTIIRVITRTGMFVGYTNMQSLSSFIMGYELGIQSCELTESISDLLSTKYKVTRYATGWINQIERYTKKKKLSWVTCFKQLALEYLYKKEACNDAEFKDTLQSIIIQIIKQLDTDLTWNSFQRYYEEWMGLVGLKEPRFKTLWSTNQLKYIRQLDKEFKQIQKNNFTSLDKLIQIKTSFLDAL